MEFKQYLVIGALSTSFLTGCGGDSDSATGEYGATYRGSEEAGVVSEDTKDNFEALGIEIAKASVASEMLFDLLPSAASMGPGGPGGLKSAVGVVSTGNTVVDQKTLNMIKTLVESAKPSDSSQLPVGIELVEAENATCSGVEGSMVTTYTNTYSDTSTYSAESHDGVESRGRISEITFTNYCSDGSEVSSTEGFVINGSIITTYNSEETEVEFEVETVVIEESTEIESDKMEFRNLTVVSPIEDPETGIKSVVYNGAFEGSETNKYTYNTETEESTDSWSEESSRKFTMVAGSIVAAFTSLDKCSSELEELDNCTSTFDFTALDGKTYRIVDGELEGDYIEGTVFDANLGSVEIEAYDLEICFDEEGNAQLDTSSEITLIDSNNVELYIEATACGVYTSTISTFVPGPV